MSDATKVVKRANVGAPGDVTNSAGDHRGWLKHFGFSLVVLIWLAVSVGLLKSGASKPEGNVGPANAASAHYCVQAGQVPPGKQPATLVATSAINPAVAFGRSTGELVRELEFQVDDPDKLLPASSEQQSACLTTYVSTFSSDTGASQLDASKIAANLNLYGSRAILQVKMMRNDSTFGLPGSYAGVISVVDPRVQRIDTPMTVTLADPVWETALGWTILLLGPGILYVWLVRGSFAGGERLKLRDFEDYLTDRNGLLTILAGFTAAGAVYLSGFINSPTWGSSTGQRIAFYIAIFTAFTAASTPVAAAGKDKPAERVTTAPAPVATSP